MIRLHVDISGELAATLEEHFCEYPGPWMIWEDEASHRYQLFGYFGNRGDATGQLDLLRKRFAGLFEPAAFEELRDEDWRDSYKAFFTPWSYRRLHWVPLWQRETFPVPKDGYVLYLDPGMAFGTGNHPTTRLCARRLVEAAERWGPDLAQRSVLDVGCGSGVLALSAARMSFGQVRAFDHETEAIKASLENACINGLEERLTIEQADLAAIALPRADLVLANIIANVLLRHREALLGAVKPGGELVLSGILAEELEAVRRDFEAATRALGGAVEIDTRVEDEWADLCLRCL